MGVVPEKPKIQPAVIHEDPKQPFNAWPVAGGLLLVFVFGIVLLQGKKNHEQIEAVTRDNPQYLVANTPFFRTASAGAPELAQPSSIKGAGLPDGPAKSEDKAKETAQTEDDATDPLADELDDQVVAPEVRPESVQLADVQMASQGDGAGHEAAVGTATVYNSSPYEITNFDLYLNSGGANFRLEPFSGTPDDPTPLSNKSIPPGARVTIPVMSNGVINADDTGAARVVSIEAIENGVTVTNHVAIN